MKLHRLFPLVVLATALWGLSAPPRAVAEPPLLDAEIPTPVNAKIKEFLTDFAKTNPKVDVGTWLSEKLTMPWLSDGGPGKPNPGYMPNEWFDHPPKAQLQLVAVAAEAANKGSAEKLFADLKRALDGTDDKEVIARLREAPLKGPPGTGPSTDPGTDPKDPGPEGSGKNPKAPKKGPPKAGGVDLELREFTYKVRSDPRLDPVRVLQQIRGFQTLGEAYKAAFEAGGVAEALAQAKANGTFSIEEYNKFRQELVPKIRFTVRPAGSEHPYQNARKVFDLDIRKKLFDDVMREAPPTFDGHKSQPKGAGGVLFGNKVQAGAGLPATDKIAIKFIKGDTPDTGRLEFNFGNGAVRSLSPVHEEDAHILYRLLFAPGSTWKAGDGLPLIGMQQFGRGDDRKDLVVMPTPVEDTALGWALIHLDSLPVTRAWLVKEINEAKDISGRRRESVRQTANWVFNPWRDLPVRYPDYRGSTYRLLDVPVTVNADGQMISVERTDTDQKWPQSLRRAAFIEMQVIVDTADQAKVKEFFPVFKKKIEGLDDEAEEKLEKAKTDEERREIRTKLSQDIDKLEAEYADKTRKERFELSRMTDASYQLIPDLLAVSYEFRRLNGFGATCAALRWAKANGATFEAPPAPAAGPKTPDVVTIVGDEIKPVSPPEPKKEPKKESKKD